MMTTHILATATAAAESSSQWFNPMSWDAPIIWVWLALFVIVFCRAGGTYLVGRLARRGIGRIKMVERFVETSSYARAEKTLDRWGAPVVAVSFLTVGFQTAVNLTAGLIRMTAFRYLGGLIIGGAMWATIYSTIGVVSFKAISLVYERWPGPTIAALIALAVVFIGWLVVKVRKSPGAACSQR